MNNVKYLTIIVIVTLGLTLSAGGIAITAHYQDNQVTHVHTSFASDADLVDWINANFMSEGEGQTKLNELTTVHDGMMGDHENLIATVGDLKQKVALLEARYDFPAQPKDIPTFDTVDFDLKLANAQAVYKSIFNRNEVVLITGQTDFERRGATIIIEYENEEVVKQKTFNTLSDGSFTEAYITNDQTLVGDYKVTVSIGNKHDSITFEIR